MSKNYFLCLLMTLVELLILSITYSLRYFLFRQIDQTCLLELFMESSTLLSIISYSSFILTYALTTSQFLIGETIVAVLMTLVGITLLILDNLVYSLGFFLK